MGNRKRFRGRVLKVPVWRAFGQASSRTEKPIASARTLGAKRHRDGYFQYPALLALLLLLLLPGCRQDMWNGSKYKPLEVSPIFANERSSRPLVAGTVARTDFVRPTPFSTGMGADGKPVTTLPVPLTRKLLDRGEQRFNIYCSPCHGLTGEGNGMIVQRGFSPPPSYHSDRLRSAPIGHFFDVITHGYGAMYSYADRVEPADRWAIAAYIRVLQRSQRAKPADVPPQAQSQLQESQP